MPRFPNVSGAQSAQIIGNINDRAERGKERKQQKKEAQRAFLLGLLKTGVDASQVGQQSLAASQENMARNREISAREDASRRQREAEGMRLSAEGAEKERDRQFLETKQFPHELKLSTGKMLQTPDSVVETRFAPIAREREAGGISAEVEARELDAAQKGQITPMQIAMMRLQGKEFAGNNDLRNEKLGAMNRDDLTQAFASVLSQVPLADQDEVVMELARRVAAGGRGREFPTPEDFAGIEGEIEAISPQVMDPALAQAMGPYGNPAFMSGQAGQEKQRKEALRQIMLRILSMKQGGLPPGAQGPVQTPEMMGEIDPETLRRLGL